MSFVSSGSHSPPVACIHRRTWPASAHYKTNQRCVPGAVSETHTQHNSTISFSEHCFLTSGIKLYVLRNPIIELESAPRKRWNRAMIMHFCLCCMPLLGLSSFRYAVVPFVVIVATFHVYTFSSVLIFSHRPTPWSVVHFVPQPANRPIYTRFPFPHSLTLSRFVAKAKVASFGRGDASLKHTNTQFGFECDFKWVRVLCCLHVVWH